MDLNNLKLSLLKARFGVSKRINFYERLMSYVEEGYPIVDTLKKFKFRYDKNKDFRGKIIAIWIEKMNRGASFTKAIKGWVPETELSLISAGESGQGISIGLKEAIRFTLASRKIKNTIISGSAYPLLLLVIVLGAISGFAKYMAPTFLTIIPLARWPDDARNLYSISSFVVNDWMYLLTALVAVTFVISYTMARWSSVVRRKVFDKIPPWSIYKSYNNSAFLINLSSTMKSGVSLNDSIKNMSSNAGPWFNFYLKKMLLNLRKGGKNYGEHLDVGFLDQETAGDVIDYSELGKFEKAIYSIGEQNIEKSVVRIQAQMAIVRGIMLFVIAFTISSIYSTSVSLNTAASEQAANARH
jgi:type II secretory pathway component PulF